MSPNTICVYLIIIVLTYIYTHHIVKKYGDIISNSPEYDLLGRYKCVPQTPGCEDQHIDYWIGVRFLVFMLIGISNPHAHTDTLKLIMLSQAYAYAKNVKGKYILNPIAMILGYSTGSILC